MTNFVPQLNNQIAQAKVPTPRLTNTPIAAPQTTIPAPADDTMWNNVSDTTKQKYGVTVSPYFLKAVHQQESSGNVDPNNYALAFGLANGKYSAKAALGKDYLPDTSFSNSAQNASNYLAYRHLHTYNDMSTKDMSKPENQVEWYVQNYVGMFPGDSRPMKNAQGKIVQVTYNDVANSFRNVLAQTQPGGQSFAPRSVAELNKPR
jgi:hypothetical protein